MDSRQARELLAAFEGAGSSWTWSLHPPKDDLNAVAHEAEVVGNEAAAFIFRRIADSWEQGHYPEDVTIVLKVATRASDV